MVAVLRVSLSAFMLAACAWAHAEEAKPFELPTYAGDKPSHNAPPLPDKPGPIPDARELYERALNCWPAASFLRAEVGLEGRLQNERTTYLDTTSGTVQGTGRAGVALVARIPLYSAIELDREREREYTRRTKLADSTGTFIQAVSDRQKARRELSLMRALERRAQERIRVGVAETAEQVKYLEKVAQLEGELIKLGGQLQKSRLELIGHCDPGRANDVDAYLMTYIDGRKP